MWITSAFILLSFIAAVVFFCALVISGRSAEDSRWEAENAPTERTTERATVRTAERKKEQSAERSTKLPALSQKI